MALVAFRGLQHRELEFFKDDLLRGIRRLDRYFCQLTESDSSGNGDSSDVYFT